MSTQKAFPLTHEPIPETLQATEDGLSSPFEDPAVDGALFQAGMALASLDEGVRAALPQVALEQGRRQHLLAGSAASLLEVVQVDGDQSLFRAVVQRLADLVVGFAIAVRHGDGLLVEVVVDLPELGGGLVLCSAALLPI